MSESSKIAWKLCSVSSGLTMNSELPAMEFDSTRRLRTSSSRNFSRPFPSPLSTGALNTPTRPSREYLAHLPLSASHGNALRSVTSHDSLVTNRLIDFAGTYHWGPPATKIIDSNSDTSNSRSQTKDVQASLQKSASAASPDNRYET